MMKMILRAGASLAVLALALQPAQANFDVTTGSGTHIFAIDGSNQGTSLCAATSTECYSHVIINTAGAPLFVTGNAGLVTGAGGTFPATESGTWNVGLSAGSNAIGSITNSTFGATQATASNLLAEVGGLGASGSALVGNPVQIGGSDGTDTRALSTDASGHAIVEPGNTANTTAWLVTGAGGTFPITGSIGNTSFAATQATASALNATVVGTGTFAAQLTGTTNNINNIAGTVSLPTGAATSALQPTNAAQASTTTGQTGHLMQGAATTGAPSYTTGQTDPLSLDLAGNLRVNCITGCSGAGGTSSNFGATFPTPGTAAGAEYLSSAPTLTSGQMVALQTTVNGSLHTTVDNTLSPGSAASASSSPVVIASDQAAVAIKAASAAIATGAIASGAFASGSIASGAFASGSLASGAGVDGWNATEGTKADSAYAGSGSASVVAALKGMYNIINTPPPLGTTGGWTPCGNCAAALSNTVISVKSSAGWLGKSECYNPNASVEYVEFFNVASGSVTLGTTAYLDFIPVPTGATVGFVLPVQGEQFGTAISIAAVTALNGSSAPATALNCAIAYN